MNNHSTNQLQSYKKYFVQSKKIKHHHSTTESFLAAITNDLFLERRLGILRS